MPGTHAALGSNPSGLTTLWGQNQQYFILFKRSQPSNGVVTHWELTRTNIHHCYRTVERRRKKMRDNS